MKSFVIDASVVLAYLLVEKDGLVKQIKPYFRKADKKLIILMAPQLLKHEVGNGIRYSESGFLSASKAYYRFLQLPISYPATESVHFNKTLEFSYELQTTFYDTHYHYLAMYHKAIFLTCDNKYYKKAKSLGNIKLLG
jgi:predicted nucleic acid-binding protein